MLKIPQALLYLNQLKSQYPAAFKRNFLFYSLIKTKGLIDEIKEILPWLLAAMIFVSSSMVLGDFLQKQFTTWSEFRSEGIAVLAIMIFFMLVCPLIIKQMKHSSISMYKSVRHTPIKLTVLIILQALNIAYIESSFLQALLFFFALSFGFVKFYKENLFRSDSESTGYFCLQEIRRVNYWTYKQILKTKLRLRLSKSQSAQHTALSQQLKQMQDLHLETLHFEHKLCKSIKHIDIDAYLEEMSK